MHPAVMSTTAQLPNCNRTQWPSSVMSVDTGLSVPIFNVLKYFVISVFLEAIVRTSLDNVEVFFRALDLYHGRPVSLNPSRVDRYNLSAIIRFCSLPRLFFTLFLACCAYAVEILLEFSSTAQVTRFSTPGLLDLYQPTHRACTPLQLNHHGTMELMADLARSCVRLTEDKYIFYNVSWQRQNRAAPLPLCVPTRDNILQEDDRIFKSIRYANGSREDKSITSFRISLIKHTWQSNYNRTRYAVLRFTEADVQSASSSIVEGRKFTRAVVVSRVEGTNIQCVGTVFGRHGDGVMSLRVYGCFQDIAGGHNYFQMVGTSIIEKDAEFVDSIAWSTLSNVGYGTAIFNFTSGVADIRNMESVQALTMFLAAGTAKDVDSVNKYAAVYKHCSDFFVPQDSDNVRKHKFEKAASKMKISVSVAKWALVLLVLWPILLWWLSAGLHIRGKRMKLPMNIRGEGDIGLRWLARSSARIPKETSQSANKKQKSLSFFGKDCFKWFRQPEDVFLNVEVGEIEDDIVVGSRAFFVDRSSSSCFKNIY